MGVSSKASEVAVEVQEGGRGSNGLINSVSNLNKGESMSLLKMKWQAAVLMGITGILVFAGGALAVNPPSNGKYRVVCSGTVQGVYGSTLATLADSLKGKCVVIDSTTPRVNDTIWRWGTTNTNGATVGWGAAATGSFLPDSVRNANTLATTGRAGFTWVDSTGTTLDYKADGTRNFRLGFVAATENLWDSVTSVIGLDSVKSLLTFDSTNPRRVDVSVKSLKITDARTGNTAAQKIYALYNWSSFTTWIGNGKTIYSGQALADLEIPAPVFARASISGVGKPVYRFVRTSPRYDSTVVPTIPGDYDIWVSFEAGDNNDATNVNGTVVNQHYVALTTGGKLTVEYSPLQDWALTSKGDTAVTYSSTGKYVINGPTLISDFGVIDTVVYDSIWVAGGSYSTTIGADNFTKSPAVGLATPGTVTGKGATFTLSVGPTAQVPVVTGAYKITATIRGKDPVGVTPRLNWEIKGVTFFVGIKAKELQASDVTVLPGGNAYTYSGRPIDGLVRVNDGNKVLKESELDSVDNDYARNKKIASGGSGTVFLEDYDSTETINAGTAKVWVEGLGNYKGVVEKTFTIAKKSLVPRLRTTTLAGDSTFRHVTPKRYDGTTKLDTLAFTVFDSVANTANPEGGVDVEFVGLVNSETLANVDDYTFTATLNNATVGTGRAATVTVALKADGDVAKNYTLTTTSFNVTNVTVVKRDPADDASASGTDSAYVETFKYTIPNNHYFFGPTVATRRGIGQVAYQNGGTNPGAKPIQVKYTYPGTSSAGAVDADFIDANTGVAFVGDTTRAPRFAGTYAVKAVIEDSTTNSAKHVKSGMYTLGDYTIKEPGIPSIDNDLPTGIENRVTRTTTLEVNATAWNYGTTAAPVWGTLTYRWFRLTTNAAGDPDSVRITGNSPKLDVTTTDSVNAVTYFVWIDNASSTFHPAVVGSVRSGNCVVTPKPAPKSIVGQVVITKPDSVVYSGAFIEPNSANEMISVQFFESITGADTNWVGELTQQTVTDGDGDYRLTYTNNKNVGTATILVSGVNDYTGGVSVTFKIVKKTLTVLDLAYVDKRPYTGEALGANVRPVVQGETGMGAITVTYNGQATVPVEQGVYNLAASVAAGTNYTAAANLSLGAYEIGMGVLDSTCFTVETKSRLTTDPNLAKGVGAVQFVKGTGFGDSIFITYDGLTDVPTEEGTYDLAARILGGTNYAAGTASLGVYKVTKPTAVAEVDRVIPNVVVVEEAAVAPIKAVAASFTAGPSPAKTGSAIKFFSAKPVKSGSLYVFDAAGNNVAKVSAKAGTGEIGSWNLTNKGVAVSEGTYVVKGALIGKDGTREKVSFVFSVVR